MTTVENWSLFSQSLVISLRVWNVFRQSILLKTLPKACRCLHSAKVKRIICKSKLIIEFYINAMPQAFLVNTTVKICLIRSASLLDVLARIQL